MPPLEPLRQRRQELTPDNGGKPASCHGASTLHRRIDCRAASIRPAWRSAATYPAHLPLGNSRPPHGSFRACSRSGGAGGPAPRASGAAAKHASRGPGLGCVGPAKLFHGELSCFWPSHLQEFPVECPKTTTDFGAGKSGCVTRAGLHGVEAVSRRLQGHGNRSHPAAARTHGPGLPRHQARGFRYLPRRSFQRTRRGSRKAASPLRRLTFVPSTFAHRTGTSTIL